MRQRQWFREYLPLGYLGLLGWMGAFGAAVLQTFASASDASAQSNIVPDNTLGAENSNVVPNYDGLPVEVINGGALRGQNLFHSFLEFNVSEGREAYFFSPNVNIQNIVTRVTGSDRSAILGVLGTFGNSNPNLFLINPNGIIFGPDASLDVGGSFVATTADAIGFGNTGIFSAKNPEAPSPLLTINPSALLFNQIVGAIQNNSVATAGRDPAGFDAFGLRVSDGKSLLLVGGKISMDGGQLNASGGRVELGGLAEPGTVALSVDGNNLSLDFPVESIKADVSLTNKAYVYVEAAGGGSIAVNARNVDILGGSVLSAGIGQGLGSVGAVAGDIVINATEAVKIDQSALIQNNVYTNSTGNSGNIKINTGSLKVSNSTQIQSTTEGKGDAGSVNINARGSISFDAGDVLTTVEQTGIGNGGNIKISADNVSITNDAQLLASTRGKGAAGNVLIDARDRVSFDNRSAAISAVEQTGVGIGGNIKISTDTLSITNGAQLVASTRGKGNAGNVLIDARDRVSFDSQSAVFSAVERTGVGIGGDIKISADNVSITNNAQLIASTRGKGDAGNVFIDARDSIFFDTGDAFSIVEQTGSGIGGNINISTEFLSVNNGSVLAAATQGKGDAGSVNINARSSVSFNAGAASSTVEQTGIGIGGNINISADTVSVTNGAQLQAATQGKGDAGSVNINARGSVSFDNRSAAFSTVERTGVGIGGNINISADSVSVTNGAQLQASTQGKGDAGNVIINTQTSVSFDNKSAVLNTVGQTGVGTGGDIKINADSVSVTNGAALIASTQGKGDASNVLIDARGSVSFDNRSAAFSTVEQTGVGIGGNIKISGNSVSITNGAQLASATQGKGNAGNVLIDARGSVSFNAGNAFSTVEQTGVGIGGNINISAGSVSVTNGAKLQSLTRGKGDAGNVLIDARGNISFDNKSDVLSTVEPTGDGIGGNIKISADSVSVTNDARLAATTLGKGDAGNVLIDARGSVSFDGKSVAFSTVEQTGSGIGGNIKISANSVSVTNGALLASATRGKGDAGNVLINARNSIFFNTGYAFSSVERTGVGIGGNIKISADSVSITNGGGLVASTRGEGNAGNVLIDARNSVFFDNRSAAFSTVNETGVGIGGDIKISADSVFVTNGAELQAFTRGKGDAGNILIDARGSVSFDARGTALSNVEQTGVGSGGDIKISADSVSVTNGARLAAVTQGKGDAGNVLIDARGSVSFNGKSVVFSTVEQTGAGIGGNIKISADSVSITNGGGLVASTRGKGNAGNVLIDARSSVSFDDRGVAASTVEQTGVGIGGDIKISADSVSVTNGAQLQASTRGKGNAGNVLIDARGSVSFDDRGVAASTVEQTGVGIGGDIKISADNVSVTNGAQLIAATQGKGDAGNIQVNAKNSVSVYRTSLISGLSSGLFTSNSPNSTGKGGDIIIDARALRVSDGAVLDARTSNNRNGGNITLNVRQAEILNGGQLLSISSSSGNAGKITLSATKEVIVNGSDRTFNDRVAQFGTAAPTNPNSGLFVLSQGNGIAGDIEVISPKVTLDNQGRLSAESALGNGGNIKLLVNDLLLLRRGSQISTNAGTAQKGGDGGNININSKYIIAFPQENSDLTANAYTGTGGQVQINSQGIFGIEARSRPTNKSDITASSELGIAGVTDINSPDTSSLRNSLNQLPENIIDTNALLANSCITRRKNEQSGTFFITGSGGLAERPGDAPLEPFSTGGMQSVSIETESPKTTNQSRPWKIGDPIIEPQGLYQLANGKLVLSRECPYED